MYELEAIMPDSPDRAVTDQVDGDVAWRVVLYRSVCSILLTHIVLWKNINVR